MEIIKTHLSDECLSSYSDDSKAILEIRWTYPLSNVKMGSIEEACRRGSYGGSA